MLQSAHSGLSIRHHQSFKHEREGHFVVVFPVFRILYRKLWKSSLGCVRVETRIDTASTEKVIAKVGIGISEEAIARENESLRRRELRLACGVNEGVKRAVCPPQSK